MADDNLNAESDSLEQMFPRPFVDGIGTSSLSQSQIANYLQPIASISTQEEMGERLAGEPFFGILSNLAAVTNGNNYDTTLSIIGNIFEDNDFAYATVDKKTLAKVVETISGRPETPNTVPVLESIVDHGFSSVNDQVSQNMRVKFQEQKSNAQKLIWSKLISQLFKSGAPFSIRESREWSRLLQQVVIDSEAAPDKDFLDVLHTLAAIHEAVKGIPVPDTFINFLIHQAEARPEAKKEIITLRHVVFGNPNALRKAHLEL